MAHELNKFAMLFVNKFYWYIVIHSYLLSVADFALLLRVAATGW